MNINSIGLNAYQQSMDKTQNAGKSVIDKQNKANETVKVNVPSQTNKIGSKLGVKLKAGEFTDMLSEDEKQALEMVFAKFRNIAGTYGNNGATSQATQGNFVDVKL